MLQDLILKNRSYRRFQESETIDQKDLIAWIDLARLSASARNNQPLKYTISSDPKTNELIFPNLFWAAGLKDWSGPEEGERPSAYIIVLGDTSITKDFHVDHGIAAHSILLGATEQGYGGCILGAINRPNLRKNLNITEQYEILFVLALGKPKEKIILESIKNNDTKYWRDNDDIHHVPKRGMDEILIHA